MEGPFNLAAEPVIDTRVLAERFGTRAVQVPARLVRTALAAAWRLHLAPASPELFDAVMRRPLMDTSRAREVLAWSPSRTGLDALAEMLHGLQQGAGTPTPPLEHRIPGRRLHEIATGVGQRQ